MTLYKWSQLAGNNGLADSSCQFPEGMAPSAVNDGVRGAMAAVAKYRDDTAGGITTAGTSSAYTLASYEQFDSLPHLAGQVVAFTPHATNAGACTLNVDGLGAKPLRSAPGVELPTGTIVQGTPYVALYNNSDGAFYLHGLFGNPYNIPIAGCIDYIAATAPNSYFALPYGQAISRTTYATLFSLIGTTYGPGDGSTTFNIPDFRGRVSACPDNMGGTTANRLTSGSMAAIRHSLGGAGGEDAHILAQSELPTAIGATQSTSTIAQFTYDVTAHSNGSAGGFQAVGPGQIASSGLSGTVTTQPITIPSVSVTNAGGGAAHNVMQPTLLVNRILRII
ncbi:phage tail protein [Bradyrhizobium sp. HKCCYLRH2015]|uniref:phage tail protein n=1 Tax=Bradyrhizobium sp. HKCCYLRH2015 TaxID=3420742 RepID=UPI003EC00876